MPIKNRHSMKHVGAVNAGAESDPIDMSEATKAVVHLEGNGAVCTVECSPDGGTTWAQYFQGPDKVLATRTVAAGPDAISLDPCPKTIRIQVATANMTDCWVEGVREVA